MFFFFSDVVESYVLPTLTISTNTFFSTAVNSSSRMKTSKLKKKGQFFSFVACTSVLLFCPENEPQIHLVGSPQGCQLNLWPFSSDCQQG